MPNSITLAGSKQLRTSFEPDSVMEFGFYKCVNQINPQSCYFSLLKCYSTTVILVCIRTWAVFDRWLF